MQIEYWCPRQRAWLPWGPDLEKRYTVMPPEPGDDRVYIAGSSLAVDPNDSAAMTLRQAWVAAGRPALFDVIGGNGWIHCRSTAGE